MYNQNNILNGYNPNIDYTKMFNQTTNNTVNPQDIIVGAIVDSYEQVKNYPVSNQATTFLVLRSGDQAWSKYLNESGVAVISAYSLKQLVIENNPPKIEENSNVLKPSISKEEIKKEPSLIEMFGDFKNEIKKELGSMKNDIKSLKGVRANESKSKSNTSK